MKCTKLEKAKENKQQSLAITATKPLQKKYLFQKSLNERMLPKRSEMLNFHQASEAPLWAGLPEIAAQKYCSANYSWHKQEVW